MKKEVIEAIEDSIDHWKRMIKWVKKQDRRMAANPLSMLVGAGQDWSSDSCSLCQQQQNPRWEPGCPKCPLAQKYGLCSCVNLTSPTKNAWGRVTAAKTWAGWLQHGKRMLKQLESL